MKRILNAGCGNDEFGTDFVDIQPHRKGVIKVDLNSEKLPYKDGTFDEVVCTQVLEHLSNPYFALKEFKRVLKKGGKLNLTIPNKEFHKYKVISLHMGVNPFIPPTYPLYEIQSVETIEGYLSKLGLKITKIEYLFHGYTSGYLRMYKKLFSVIGLYPNIFIQAKK